ncbi:twin-arginine translocation pathway signal [Novosphingobium sp. Rr 2-17]|uniref:NAD(P)-binding protein n=1 Tax=Novosphingobium sp. Rr 2-17 TaxID=555793 RepID=UPI0002697AD7|nr:NAD(P)-binding protein [Novosphingobium sp. Rr 2-17]EIZ81167.1 twin-arginine translocation pathway signal [Novosphingobium sp. Rr 2-17]
MKVETSRRGVLAGASATFGVSLLAGCEQPAIAGTLDGADWQRGHLLRDGRFPLPEGPVEEVGVVIAGGGVAGLAAGWRLAEAGFDDFTLFELEDRTGGNARSGLNAVSAYPLGAHYLPVPNREATALRHMLRGFGMIVGDTADGPTYDPYQLCADLEERVLWRGEWQEGLFPQSGLPLPEHDQRRSFDARMAAFRAARGSDGRPAFAVPSALSSTDPHYTALDGHSFAAWLDREGFTAPALRAYLRYCCRDDYGTEPDHVSAWAGIHYFAARRGWAAHGDGDRELTWPEGNDRLATLMAARISPHVRSGHSVFRVEAMPDGGAELDVFDHAPRRSRRLRAKIAILAMPHFVAARVAPRHCAAGRFSYAPWVVANVTVSRHPSGKGVPLAWDNVSTASDALGYVVATHQSSSTDAGPTVLTWYMPLSRHTPQDARRIMQTRSLERWQHIVREDLLAMNPELDGSIERIDVWRWGHAMIRPMPGFLTDPARLAARSAKPPVLFAHSDLGGLSLFEEAHHYGVVAAEAAMSHLGHAHETLSSS